MDNWIEVYGAPLRHEALVRITDEIEKNSDFVIDKSNVRDYFECDSFLDVIEANNIEYNIELKRPSEWNEKGQHSYGEVTLFVYIKESDEEKLTFTEPNYFDLPEFKLFGIFTIPPILTKSLFAPLLYALIMIDSKFENSISSTESFCIYDCVILAVEHPTCIFLKLGNSDQGNCLVIAHP